MGSIGRKVAVGVAVVTLATGTVVGVASGSAAHAATAACGSGCVEPYSQQFGSGSILSTAAGTVEPGLTVDLAAAGAYSAEDFIVHDFGPVSNFYQAGLVGPVVGQTWPADPTYEFEYAPNGIESGLCLGLATAAAAGEGVTLQACGVNANTVWIGLSADDIGGYQPLINATDTIADTPYVLTAARSARVRVGSDPLYLEVNQLSLVDGAFDPGQMWANETGVLGG